MIFLVGLLTLKYKTLKTKGKKTSKKNQATTTKVTCQDSGSSPAPLTLEMLSK